MNQSTSAAGAELQALTEKQIEEIRFDIANTQPTSSPMGLFRQHCQDLLAERARLLAASTAAPDARGAAEELDRLALLHDSDVEPLTVEQLQPVIDALTPFCGPSNSA